MPSAHLLADNNFWHFVIAFSDRPPSFYPAVKVHHHTSPPPVFPLLLPMVYLWGGGPPRDIPMETDSKPTRDEAPSHFILHHLPIRSKKIRLRHVSADVGHITPEINKIISVRVCGEKIGALYIWFCENSSGIIRRNCWVSLFCWI